MSTHHRFNRIALAIAGTFAGGSMLLTAPVHAARQTPNIPGTYLAGDFHNHTTCSDGSISMQKLVKKATDKTDTPWGLDWFVQAGHGGNGTRNCTLVEDSSLSTPAYPYITNTSPNTTWTASIGNANVKGDNGASTGTMWRWQSVQEYQYAVMEYLNAYKNLPLFLGQESVVAGHEHASTSVITGQIPASLSASTLPTTPGPITSRYAPLGNANVLAQWTYCFDRGDTDTSRGNTTDTANGNKGPGTGVGNNWDCTNPASASSTDPTLGWNTTAKKLLTPGGSGSGTKGHQKTVEAVKWQAAFDTTGGANSYYVPAHLERPGPFSPDGSFGWNVEHLRDLNNAAPNIAFGFESQPGHGAANNRGEYQVLRNTFPNGAKVDSVGGTTYGGTGVYAAQIGGVWDALLGEGRNWWFFASSDWHNRGSFGPDDRRSTQDFYPGEYQRNYAAVLSNGQKPTPQQIVAGLRSGNNFASSGQLIDRLAFVACSGVSESTAASYALAAATKNYVPQWPTGTSCATMGQKLRVSANTPVAVAIVVRDPAGTNYSPYTFNNPSLLQIGVQQPLNQPVLDHVDVIGGLVSGYKVPGAADYSGEWPRNTAWLAADGTTPSNLSTVPAAAKNTSAALAKTFNAGNWTVVTDPNNGTKYLQMTYTVPAVVATQYLRLRGSNLPASVPYETDANGNPLADLYTNSNDTTMLRIACTTVHSANSQFDGCPDHLATATSGTSKTGLVVTNPIAGQKAVSFDVAAWADLWFYSNPIYIEVSGGTLVAGVQ